ncbi:MAG: hypothetical protein RLZZ46_133 [Bacteroidota bacterium]|jgi:hypothetical protein
MFNLGKIGVIKKRPSDNDNLKQTNKYRHPILEYELEIRVNNNKE